MSNRTLIIGLILSGALIVIGVVVILMLSFSSTATLAGNCLHRCADSGPGYAACYDECMKGK